MQIHLLSNLKKRPGAREVGTGIDMWMGMMGKADSKQLFCCENQGTYMFDPYSI